MNVDFYIYSFYDTIHSGTIDIHAQKCHDQKLFVSQLFVITRQCQ